MKKSVCHRQLFNDIVVYSRNDEATLRREILNDKTYPQYSIWWQWEGYRREDVQNSHFLFFPETAIASQRRGVRYTELYIPVSHQREHRTKY